MCVASTTWLVGECTYFFSVNILTLLVMKQCNTHIFPFYSTSAFLPFTPMVSLDIESSTPSPMRRSAATSIFGVTWKSAYLWTDSCNTQKTFDA